MHTLKRRVRLLTSSLRRNPITRVFLLLALDLTVWATDSTVRISRLLITPRWMLRWTRITRGKLMNLTRSSRS